ncbi:MAG: hypothetical protein KDD92_18295 [Caldilineaceae bacterium]|nr:hypothetical protein [Caldilineaceae bacterium]
MVFKRSNTTPLINERGIRGKWNIYIKKYLGDASGAPSSLIPRSIVGISNAGTKQIKELFNNQAVFNNPKPTNYLSYLLSMGTESEDIVLDFFAGSCSTAHTVMQMNAEDSGMRRFILVQLPEPTEQGTTAYKQGFATIVDIGTERIRRAGKKIREENPDYEGDLGFKVFKLDSSNIRAWNPDASDLEQTLYDHVEHLVPGRSEEDVLYELLLKRGVDLATPIESRTVAGKSVYSIGYGVLIACLAPSIARGEVEELASGIISWHEELQPAADTHIFFRDSAFGDDVTKTNLAAILQQHGIHHVRSL